AVHGLRGVPGAPGTPGGLRRLRLVAVVVVVVVPGLPGCGRRPGGVVRVRPAPGSVRLPARASEERHPEVLPYGYCDGMANRTLHGPAPSQYVRTLRRVQCGLHPCSARSGRRVGPWAQHGVADQGDAADPLLLDGAQHLLGHVPAVRDHALPEVEPDERGRGGGAVQQRCRGEEGCPGRPPRPVRPVPRAGSPVRRSRRAAAETGEDQVLPAQHHPLGHTGRAAGVDDEPVVSGARGEAAAGRAGRLGVREADDSGGPSGAVVDRPPGGGAAGTPTAAAPGSSPCGWWAARPPPPDPWVNTRARRYSSRGLSSARTAR